MSAQRLTFYYWGQDRLANVLALAGWPVQNVHWNFYVLLLLQAIMFHTLIALIVVFVSRTVDPGRSLGSTVFTVLGVSLLVTAMLTPLATHTFMFEQQYALSLVLFVVGLALLVRCSRRWFVIGAILIVSSLVVVPASVLFFPLAAVLGDRWDWRRLAIAAGTTAAALAFAAMAPSIFFDGEAQTAYRTFSLSLFISGWRDAASNVVDGLRLAPTIVFLVLSVAILVVRRSEIPTRLRWVLLGAPPFAIAWFCTFTANRWVTWNLHFPRYYFPVYLTLIVVVSAAAVIAGNWARDVLAARTRSFATRPARMALVGFAVSSALLVVGVFRLLTDDGIPVIANAGPAAEDVRDLDVEVVVGDYWTVWPIVYASLSRGYQVFGISPRAEALADELTDEVERTFVDPGDDIALMCIGLDEPTCVLDFARFVGGDWEVASTALVNPLVVIVRPAAE
ncbi:MAG: hypothetical protein HOJ85_12800 [Ilumatobacter sp.]|jgi:hypothetical protein|nr:hypothetical protein [Ilumatobacter sp.]MBT5275145.1 hypothetical protein [Ilumatobacter sp.]MBT5554636.1 hypothetical protein [Ilumatobacter sp.]MDG0976147.1 hypothetical protein [Ilumatobacter sp.]MDG1391555.1 hypothetical protein [Ilumatobacter sp.]